MAPDDHSAAGVWPYAIATVVLPLFGQVLNVTGHERFGMRHNVPQFVDMPIAASPIWWE
jgi:hypothetical protein